MEVAATAKQVRVSPSKVHGILEAIKHRPVEEVVQVLQFLPSPTARIVAKVVRSAVANAENTHGLNPTTLRVVAAYANAGPTMKRFRPRARGRAGKILKRTSHITILVGDKGASGGA